ELGSVVRRFGQDPKQISSPSQRDRPARFVARRPDHPGAVEITKGLFEEPGLPASRLTGDEGGGQRPASDRIVEQAPENGEFGRASDERRPHRPPAPTAGCSPIETHLSTRGLAERAPGCDPRRHYRGQRQERSCSSSSGHPTAEPASRPCPGQDPSRRAQENSANSRASMSLNATQCCWFRYEFVRVTTPTRRSGRKNIRVVTP